MQGRIYTFCEGGGGGGGGVEFVCMNILQNIYIYGKRQSAINSKAEGGF